MTAPPRILVVDDERSMREMVSVLLRRNGYDVATANSGHQVGELLAADEEYDLVITDLLMDRGDGISVLTQVKKSLPNCEVIVITAFGTAESAVESMKKGAFDYIIKPFNVDEFMIIVRHALERQALIRENLDLRARVRGEYRFADIVGRSQAIQDVIDLVRKIADSTATVLVTGESGTGKEVIARAIHFSSARAAQPFVAINCGGLPEQLMESELFGHVRGAFTGAAEDKDGLFRAADGGTVFLDEIGELPPPLQVKMLRVLQDHRVRSVGASQESPIDARVIAATNQDLDEQVKSGRFRTDLFYRLNVIQIQLPPLRERKEDIGLLGEHLLQRLSSEQGGAPKRLTSDALRALLRHDFPGNVRELANILERAATLAVHDEIEVSDLSDNVVSRREMDSPKLITLPQDGLDLDSMMSRVERSLIEQALDRTGGVRTQAAQLLGISFRSLRYRLNKLGSDIPEPDTN